MFIEYLLFFSLQAGHANVNRKAESLNGETNV